MFSMNQCIAKKSNGEQCAKKKNNNSDFCGTHVKSTPYGCVPNIGENIDEDMITETLEVKTVIEKGIVYFMDKFNNVYHTEDIMQGISNPRIILQKELDQGAFDISIIHSNR